jgi:hypothetical protein
VQKIKAGLGPLIGNAGEYAVMSELLKRDVIAALAPRNTPAFDILATKGGKTIRIRVKTKSGNIPVWQYSAKEDQSIFREMHPSGDFTVLVSLGTGKERNRYFVVATTAVDTWLKESYQRWVDTPGRGGRKRNPRNPKRMLGIRTELEPCEDDWDSLWANEPRT